MPPGDLLYRASGCLHAVPSWKVAERCRSKWLQCSARGLVNFPACGQHSGKAVRSWDLSARRVSDILRSLQGGHFFRSWRRALHPLSRGAK